MVVEVIVQSSDKDVNIRVILLHTLDAFGCAMMHMSLICLTPSCLRKVIAAEAEPPVASIGSTTITSRSSMSAGILK